MRGREGMVEVVVSWEGNVYGTRRGGGGVVYNSSMRGGGWRRIQ
jgi:hypothetical protein